MVRPGTCQCLREATGCSSAVRVTNMEALFSIVYFFFSPLGVFCPFLLINLLRCLDHDSLFLRSIVATVILVLVALCVLLLPRRCHIPLQFFPALFPILVFPPCRLLLVHIFVVFLALFLSLFSFFPALVFLPPLLLFSSFPFSLSFSITCSSSVLFFFSIIPSCSTFFVFLSYSFLPPLLSTLFLFLLFFFF